MATILTVTHAGIIGPSAGIITPSGATVATALPPTAAVVRTENFDPNPQYSFSYSVADGLTGTYFFYLVKYLRTQYLRTQRLIISLNGEFKNLSISRILWNLSISRIFLLLNYIKPLVDKSIE